MQGDIDAAPQPAPWNLLAEDAGHNLVGEVNDDIPEIVFAALIGWWTRASPRASARVR